MIGVVFKTRRSDCGTVFASDNVWTLILHHPQYESGAAMKDLSITSPTGQGIQPIRSLAAKAEEYVSAAKAKNTIRAYKADWHHFEQWCDRNGLRALPAEATTICMYLATYADVHSVGTLSRRITTISEAHRASGYSIDFRTHPQLTALWAGIKRTKGTLQHGKAALLTSDLKRMVAVLPQSTLGIRDQAVLLLGFVGAFRRSELVALNVEDLRWSEGGVEVTVRRSKTDQFGQGTLKAIPYSSDPALCPVRALKRWLGVLGMQDGPLFVRIGKGGAILQSRLGDRAVALILKRQASVAGLDERKFSGHSLRVGFVTQAALNGATDREIMAQSGHKSRTMVDRYVRVARIWDSNAATRLGL